MTEQQQMDLELILLKAQLLGFSKSDWLEVYQEKEDYENLLYYLCYSMKKEPPFWVANFEKIKTILDVTASVRWKFKDKKLWADVNEFIRVTNTVNELSEYDRNQISKSYIWYQLILRNYNQQEDVSLNTLQEMICFDSETTDGLENENYEELIGNVNFLYSTNYLLNQHPEFYEDNPEYLEATKKIIQQSFSSIENINNKENYRNEAQKTLQKINKNIR